jgi:SAM-dependent methyltransferase
VTFAVPAEAYDRFVGRYSYGLADALAREAGIGPEDAVLDVGAGPGVGTRRLAELAGRVAAVEPSGPFAGALRERLPEVDVRQGAAEELPFGDGEFDAAFAQLVLNFMSDPEAGVAEMRRVTRPGGVLAACVWDYPDKMTLLRVFWDAVAAAGSPGAGDERDGMRFGREGELVAFWEEAGLEQVAGGEITVAAAYESFDDLWAPFEAGVGPAGSHAASLEPGAREELRAEYRRRLDVPDGPFELEARAWFAVGRTS